MNKITEGYLVTALWCSPDPNDENDFLDARYSLSDFSKESIEEAAQDVERFVNIVQGNSALDSLDWTQPIGHDFWLTRNGHGAGFWDGDYGDVGDRLTEICERDFGQTDIYVGDDGKLYFSM